MAKPSLECRLINASYVAYAIEHDKIDPQTPGYDKIGLAPGTVPVCFSDGAQDINAGFVAETADNWVFLVFRGTLTPYTGDFWAWVDDWLQDFDIGPQPWIVNNNPFGQVEGGFANAMVDLWPLVRKALAPIDLKSKKGIIVSGHSKGAALSFLAASLVKAANPSLLVQDCCFAAPLTCDRTFRENYDALGIRPFTVRYQNEYDLVPFLPWVPVLDALAAAERLSRPDGANKVVTTHLRARMLANDYVPVGILRYITTTCAIEHGEKAQHDADMAMLDALLGLHFMEIVEAHSGDGRYLNCVCK
jgi:hypothetical protein